MLPVCAKLLITNLVQCACADGSEPIIAQPHPSPPAAARTKCAMVLALLEHHYQTIDRYENTDLVSFFARGLVAMASTCPVVLSKRMALSCQLFDNASLWPEVLFFVHMALQF